jgi:CubicO group peptidase (beta-lactamase class C family)
MSRNLMRQRAWWRPLLLAALVLLAAHAAPSRPLQAQRPDVAAIDRYIAEARQAWDVPGLAVAIVKDGRTVHAKGYGVRDMTEGGAVDEHTLFAIASNTKAFTAATLAILVDEGRLHWDDRVQEHLPWFQLYDPYVSREMRIRDLLSHRCGLGTFSGDLIWYGTGYSTEDVVRRARHLPQAGLFRGSYGYSNLMFMAAGEVVRQVTGEPWEVFVQRRILQPLGMRRTVLTTNSLPHLENVASPHGPAHDAISVLAWYNWDAMVAAAGIISSVSEMAEWLKLQLNAGVTGSGDTIFPPAQSHIMWTMHTPQEISAESRELYPSTNFRGFGLGWALNDYHGRLVTSHEGGYDGMYSRVVLVPQENLGIIVLTNSMTGISTAIANHIVDAYLGAEPKDWSGTLRTRERQASSAENERRAAAVRQTVPNTSPSLALSAYAGTYGGNVYGDASVSLEDGQLVLRLLPNPDLVADLRHLQFDTFVIEWRRPWPWFGAGTAQFLLSPAGSVTELKLDVPTEDVSFAELDLRRRGD